MEPTQEDLRRLWETCRAFVDERQISHPETIYQCDRVIIDAPEFIERICDVVGYHEFDDSSEV